MRSEADIDRPISVAIVAMGGQGGGVLSDWIVDIAEHAEFMAQATSVPGVAQRTGATVYYLELFPRKLADAAGRDPVMALMPVPGDVDIVIAGELVEAGRALMRGFVSPERTTLIASAHRDYSMGEKMAMGDERVDSNKIVKLAGESSRKFICFDMAELAEETGSVISSVLLGALAGSQALPFSREDCEAAITRSGVAVAANLAGFSAGYDQAKGPAAASANETPIVATGTRFQAGHPQVQALLSRVSSGFPDAAQKNLVEGIRRLIDYQDVRYAGEYLNRLEEIRKLDEHCGGESRNFKLTTELARFLALWMSYEDTIRVADLKTRRSRFDRFRKEVRAEPDQLVYVTEFMHPRVEEICDTLPHALGAFILKTTVLRGFIGLFCRSGRQIPTSKLSGYLLLYCLAGLRRWRRASYRFRREQDNIRQWLDTVREIAPVDYELSVELAECQRLIKGYGETHERGTRNFNRIMENLAQIRAQRDPAQTVKELRAAALADEHGETLDAVLKKVA